MTGPLEIIKEASRLGLRLEPRGDKLAVIPANRVKPDFAALLRQHKGEVMALLESKTAGLTADKAPWLHIARQVLAGEFDGCDKSTRESIAIGLRSIGHPDTTQALARLKQRQAER